MDYIREMQRTGTLNIKPSSQIQTNEQPEIIRIIEQQKNHFERLNEINKNKIFSLEKEVNQLREELEKATSVLNKIQDKEIVTKTREELFGRREKPPSDKPIDRNGVAPKDVQIEKIFNFSSRKF